MLSLEGAQVKPGGPPDIIHWGKPCTHNVHEYHMYFSFLMIHQPQEWIFPYKIFFSGFQGDSIILHKIEFRAVPEAYP